MTKMTNMQKAASSTFLAADYSLFWSPGLDLNPQNIFLLHFLIQVQAPYCLPGEFLPDHV